MIRIVLAAALAAGLTAGLVVCSGLPWVADAGDHALVRLSWRAVGERIEECRAPTEQELAALPPHMRRREICEGRTTPFRLAVSIDGAPVLEETIRPGGARRDRPVYVFRELPVAPGTHRVRISFAAEPPAEPAPVTLDASLVLAPRQVALVTYDPSAAELRVVRGDE